MLLLMSTVTTFWQLKSTKKFYEHINNVKCSWFLGNAAICEIKYINTLLPEFAILSEYQIQNNLNNV